MTESLFSKESIADSKVVIPAMQAIGKYLMRAFTRGHDPMYDAVLTISSVGVQIPLFFLTSFSDAYATKNVSKEIQGLTVTNHHYTDSQTVSITADIMSTRTHKTLKPGSKTEYDTTIDHNKTPEHNLLREVGVLATVLNLKHNFDDLDGITSSAPSISIHRTNFENPFAYEPTSDIAIFRIFMDVIMQWGLLVDFEAPTKVYKNLRITSMATKPKKGIVGANEVTLSLTQTNIQDFKFIKPETKTTK